MPEYRLLTLLNYTTRTYFIRLFYNYENLFGQGLSFCLKPHFSHKANWAEDKPDMPEKHEGFFNMNEYMSGFAIGIIINSEHQHPDRTEKIKKVLSSVLGSLGDTIIYRIVLPVMVLFALNIFLISGNTLTGWAVSFIISQLVIFNIFSFAIRFYGLKAGIKHGIGSLKIFKSKKYFALIKVLKNIRNFLAMSLVAIIIIRINILLFF